MYISLNVLSSFVLYLVLFFVMRAPALFDIIPVNYLVGIMVGLFVAGLLYMWLNAVRQTTKLIKTDSAEQSMLEQEDTVLEENYPIL